MDKNRHTSDGNPRRCNVCYICTEGETELNYFCEFHRKFGQKKYKLRLFKSKKSHAGGILENMEKRLAGIELKDKDMVWLVVDRDNNEKDKPGIFNKLFEWKKENKAYGVAISNPCFEYWLLLHFDENPKSVSGSDRCIEALKKHIRDYEKSKVENYTILYELEKVKFAIKNAKQIENGEKDTKITERNGSTVYELVEKLLPNSEMQNPETPASI